MNREERIFSVTMTEEELRLFSEFLGQKEFYYAPAIAAIRQGINSKRAQEYIEQHGDLDQNYNRMSIRHALGEANNIEDRSQEINQITNNPEKQLFGGRIKWHSKDQRSRLTDLYNTQRQADTRLVDNLKGERILRDSGYDDKYSSKFMERVMDKKLDSSDASTIIDKRVAKSAEYNSDPNAGRFGDIKRKFDDASIVYEAGTDGRSLGKDAALAAAGAAALGIGIHAIKKHRKKKKEAQALLESRINNGLQED